MSEVLDLFGEWAHHADGSPYVVQITPPAGSAFWGQRSGEPVTAEGTIPVQFGNRIVRGADGTERVSSVTLYVDGGSPAAGACETGAQVVVDGSRTTTVLRADSVSHAGMFDYVAVFCE